MPEITSAAPLPSTRTSHEYQQDAARRSLTRVDVTAGTGGELMVMARGFSDSGDADPQARPWEGVAVLDASGKLVADLATSGQHQSGQDPVGVCTFALPPGAYILKYEATRSKHVAQSLILPAGGWRLEAYLLRKLDAHASAARPRITLLMRRSGEAWGTEEDVQLVKAAVALADERPVLIDELSQLLVDKITNPLKGIIGGHLLVIGHERDGQGLDLLNEVVRNLRGLVGTTHPDVEALSLACPDTTLRTQAPVSVAPLFERSWRMLIKASQSDPRLVPLSLWQQVHATLAVAPPFLSWSTDESVQQAFRHALAQAAFGRQIKAEAAARSFMQRSFEPIRALGGRVASTIARHDAPTPPASGTLSAEALGLPPTAVAALRREYT